MSLSENSQLNKPFPVFFELLKSNMRKVFSEVAQTDYYTIKRGVPPEVLSQIMPLNPLSVIIPKEFGGRGGQVDESLMVISAAAYESLAFALTLGINSALFLQPFIKYANQEIKQEILNGFLHKQRMGGLMITEPDFGSDALNMQTSFSKSNEHFHLQGTKHWAGLTGFADYWLLTSRERDKNGNLKRDIDFFVCDTSNPDQKIVVEEFYDNLGLHQIPYGRNHIDVKIPYSQRLVPKTTGVQLMLDTLNRSRLQFPAMGLGFIQRMLDEAITHCNQRMVGGKSLYKYDQVQYRISQLQSSYTICSAMCAYASNNAEISNDLSACGMEANAFKALASDLMQEAAQSLVQLVGAKAYRYNHIAGRGIIDSRPFQIFEGSNDILYAQISENLFRLMKQSNDFNVFSFLSHFKLTEHAVLGLKDLLDFEINAQLSQRKSIGLGQIISRVIAMEMVLKLGNNSFHQELVSNSISSLQVEISGLIGSLKQKNSFMVVEDYLHGVSWSKSRF